MLCQNQALAYLREHPTLVETFSLILQSVPNWIPEKEVFLYQGVYTVHISTPCVLKRAVLEQIREFLRASFPELPLELLWTQSPVSDGNGKPKPAGRGLASFSKRRFENDPSRALLMKEIEETLPQGVFLSKTRLFQSDPNAGALKFAVLSLYISQHRPGLEAELDHWRSSLEEKYATGIILQKEEGRGRLSQRLSRFADEEGLIRDLSPISDFARVLFDRSTPSGEVELGRRVRRDNTERLDLHWITVDPEGAQDLDDALYAEARSNGNILLLVSFADAARWVMPEGEVDLFARRIGFSVYAGKAAIPMLGERLAFNELSLLPDRWRYAFTVGMEIDGEGAVVKSHFFRSLIRSRGRYSFDELQEIAKGRNGKTREVVWSLVEANRRLRFKRSAQASFLPGAAGFDPHLLVQECMIAANHMVAGIFRKYSVPVLYRVHAPPLRMLRRKFLRDIQATGTDVNMKSVFTDAVSFRRMLEDLQARGYGALVHEILDVYMTRAAYRVTNCGHSGLGLSEYTVFKGLRNYAGLENQRRAHALLDGRMLRGGDLKALERRLNLLQRRQAEYTYQLASLVEIRDNLTPTGRHRVYNGVVRSLDPTKVLVDVHGFRREGILNISADFLSTLRLGQKVLLQVEAYYPAQERFVFRLAAG